ncbi:hypothetical protein AYI69_g387 [Smittium culicis]|uniref:Uncharacterized protein n=1 Tax=Smittium culicis TaxID=133412 RepID=A0A1R1YT94_9FUNG|nr:hypothetical protein AYI69_g387 [Smittium culicis]
MFDTLNMILHLTQERMKKNIFEVQKALDRSFTIRQEIGLNDLFSASKVADNPAAIKSREIQIYITRFLQNPNYRYDAPCPFSTNTIKNLIFWDNYLCSWNSTPLALKYMNPKTPVSVITNASGIGWGVTSNIMNVCGTWDETMKNESSNCKEAISLLNAPKLQSAYWRNEKIRIQLKNMTTKAIYTNGGTTVNSKLLNLAKEWWGIAIENKISAGIEAAQALFQVTKQILGSSESRSISLSTEPSNKPPFFSRAGSPIFRDECSTTL